MLNPKNPVGKGYVLLEEDDVLEATDETVCRSTLLDRKAREGWQPLHPDDIPFIVGKKVSFARMQDLDGSDRLYRRRVRREK